MNLLDTAGFVVRHPVRTALRTVGVLKGAAEVATGRVPQDEPAPPPADVVPLQRVPGHEPLPDAVQLPPAEPHESFATEPGGFEDWKGEVAAEADERDLVEADPWQEPESDEPLLDPSLTKQVKGEMDRGLDDAQG